MRGCSRNHIRRVLAQKHGFGPSPGQFNLKMREWGFTAPRADRCVTMTNHAPDTHSSALTKPDAVDSEDQKEDPEDTADLESSNSKIVGEIAELTPEDTTALPLPHFNSTSDEHARHQQEMFTKPDLCLWHDLSSPQNYAGQQIECQAQQQVLLKTKLEQLGIALARNPLRTATSARTMKTMKAMACRASANRWCTQYAPFYSDSPVNSASGLDDILHDGANVLAGAWPTEEVEGNLAEYHELPHLLNHALEPAARLNIDSLSSATSVATFNVSDTKDENMDLCSVADSDDSWCSSEEATKHNPYRYLRLPLCHPPLRLSQAVRRWLHASGDPFLASSISARDRRDYEFLVIDTVLSVLERDEPVSDSDFDRPEDGILQAMLDLRITNRPDPDLTRIGQVFETEAKIPYNSSWKIDTSQAFLSLGFRQAMECCSSTIPTLPVSLPSVCRSCSPRDPPSTQLPIEGHPNTTSHELRDLSARYSMPARMWRHDIHPFLELLRNRLPESQERMSSFVCFCFSTIASVRDRAPDFQEAWNECLSDLARYRLAIEEADLRDGRVWANTVRTWYREAADLTR